MSLLVILLWGEALHRLIVIVDALQSPTVTSMSIIQSKQGAVYDCLQAVMQALRRII